MTAKSASTQVSNALAVLMLIGIAGGIAVAVGFLAQPLSDWASLENGLTAGGRVAGMLAGFLSLLLVIFMARLPVLEKAFGQDQLTAIHRKLGPYTIYITLLHVVLITFGYAELTNLSAWEEFLRLLFEVEKIWMALIGLILFIVAGITSYRRVRSRLSYETWWQIHFITYLAIALSFFHQVETGAMFIFNPWLKACWISYYVLAFGFILYFRWIAPTLLSKSSETKLKKIISETPTTHSYIFEGKNLDKLKAKGGQFLNFSFDGIDRRGTSHPFSLSRTPTNNSLRITVKSLGDFTRKMPELKIGQSVKLSGPYGIFTADRAKSNHVVLIAAGVGITPIRAVLEDLSKSKKVVLIWRSSAANELPLEAEIDKFSSSRNFTVHKLVGSREKFDLSAKGLLQLAPNIRTADVFICGPTGLVNLIKASLRELGIPTAKIHLEIFEY